MFMLLKPAKDNKEHNTKGPLVIAVFLKKRRVIKKGGQIRVAGVLILLSKMSSSRRKVEIQIQVESSRVYQ